MIYFPETIIQLIQRYNGYLHLLLVMHIDTYSLHGRSLESWWGRLPCFWPSYHVFPSPLSERNWCSLVPVGGPGPPTARGASFPTGSAHTPFPGSETVLNILILALYNYPEASKCRLKLQNLSKRFCRFLAPESSSLVTLHLYMMIAWLRIGEEGRNWYGENCQVMKILNMSEQNVFAFCEWNGNAKHLATPFSVAMGPIRGEGNCVTSMATGSGNSSTSGIKKKNYGCLTSPQWHTFLKLFILLT